MALEYYWDKTFCVSWFLDLYLKARQATTGGISWTSIDIFDDEVTSNDIFDDEVDSLGFVTEERTRFKTRKSIEVDLGHPISMENVRRMEHFILKCPISLTWNYTATQYWDFHASIQGVLEKDLIGFGRLVYINNFTKIKNKCFFKILPSKRLF